jgi:hypothetical protein
MRITSLIVSLLFLFGGKVFGQLEIRPFHFRPAGEFGFVMKPTSFVEVGWRDRFDNDEYERFRFGISATYFQMKPRLEVFPTVVIRQDGNGTTVLPGAQVFEKFNLGLLSLGSDFAFIHQEKLHAYLGADLTIGAIAVDYTSNTPGYQDESYSGGGYLGGGRLRLGLEYDLNDLLSVFTNVQKTGFLLSEPAGLYGATDYGIGLRITFDN